MNTSLSTSLRRKGAGSPETGYLTGQFLIAMPQMIDVRFQRSVVYICAHTAEGAMGLIVNKVLDSLTIPELMAHLGVSTGEPVKTEQVHFGGPVETSRGFVLHSCDYVEAGTLVIGHDLALTATVEILRALSRGEGPQQRLVALGYADWGPGQLDAELQANAWLHGPAEETIVFDAENDSKWARALRKLGIDISMLSSEAGHA
jgi:putative transcriptional regulator